MPAESTGHSPGDDPGLEMAGLGHQEGEVEDEAEGEVEDRADGEFRDGAEGEFGDDSDSDMEPVVFWVPSGRRLLSGLLGLNVVLLGAALVASKAFNPTGLQHQEPQSFLLILMGLSLAWMLWYLLWARHQPGLAPHTDHHAGGITVTVVLVVFAGFSMLLHVFRMGYFGMLAWCNPVTKILSAFIEGPFLALQTYLLWAHSKHCILKHKVQTRSGVILTLCTDVLLWMNAVTEDTVHMEIELEREEAGLETDDYHWETIEFGNETECRCRAYVLCLVFRKGFEILYPFTMEYYLMAGCLLYVMWKNVGRRTDPRHGEPPHMRLTLRTIRRSGVRVGPIAGAVVLLTGVTIFVLYQVWVGHREQRTTAFLMFYGYHLTVVPLMVLASLAGITVHALERRGQGKRGDGAAGPHQNPTRSLDIILLVGAALGQLALSYFSLVAALAIGPHGLMGNLDLAYSLVGLLELIVQNVFIIDGLNGPPTSHATNHKREGGAMKNSSKAAVELLEAEKATTAPSAGSTGDGKKKPWTRRAKQEICAFLILTNIMLWVVPRSSAPPV
ncbi:hypothetical protein GJAV_G00141250 [Gymnothorax javanicus]|nr:hypothetical protein GJAV_G00141250 [Gymnothorax javanicus]